MLGVAGTAPSMAVAPLSRPIVIDGVPPFLKPLPNSSIREP